MTSRSDVLKEQEHKTPQQHNHKKLQMAIAVLFSVLTVAIGFTDVALVPISDSKMIDLTVVAFVFATLIGGYRFGLPLAIVWSLVTWFNVDLEFRRWELWELIVVRGASAWAIFWFYNRAKKWHPRSPLNVYRAIIAGLFIKAVIGIPFDIMYRGVQSGLLLRAEIFVLEAALCTLFMSLLIKHLRQIHILNGVRKKGEKNNGN
jgi:hypothetical protein